MRISLGSAVAFRRVRRIVQITQTAIMNSVTFQHKLIFAVLPKMNFITSNIIFKHRRMNRYEFESSIGSQVTFKHTIYV